MKCVKVVHWFNYLRLLMRRRRPSSWFRADCHAWMHCYDFEVLIRPSETNCPLWSSTIRLSSCQRVLCRQISLQSHRQWQVPLLSPSPSCLHEPLRHTNQLNRHVYSIELIIVISPGGYQYLLEEWDWQMKPWYWSFSSPGSKQRVNKQITRFNV